MNNRHHAFESQHGGNTDEDRGARKRKVAFIPQIFTNSEVGLTTFLFEDVASFSTPIFAMAGHVADWLLAMDDRRVVGVQVWALPPERKEVTPNAGPECVASRGNVAPPQPHPASEAGATAGTGSAVTYYSEGKDARYFESLGPADLEWALKRAAMDVCDNVVSEDWMPVGAIFSCAADTISSLRARVAELEAECTISAMERHLRSLLLTKP